MPGIANDPGLGNRYLFTDGEYKGRIGLWAGAGNGGVHIEWEDSGRQDIVPYAEMENARLARDDETDMVGT